MSKRARRLGVEAERMFDFAQMFNRVMALDDELAHLLPGHEFELGFDKRGGIYVDGKPLGVNVKQRYRALRPSQSRQS